VNRKRSAFRFKDIVWELQDLLDAPREVRYSDAGNRYEYPKKGWEVIQAIMKVITEALQRGESVQIRGFGIFKVIDNPKRMVHKPFLGNYKGKLIGQSTESWPLPNRKLVVFKPSLHIEAMVNPETANWEQRRAMKTWKKA